MQKERDLNAWRLGSVFVLTLILVAMGTSWTLTRQQAESVTVVRPDHKTTLSKRTAPPNTKPTTSLPAEDVPGNDVLDLSRYPGSVRVEYEHEEQDLLRFTRAKYLSHARVDVIRAFYRGVFRAEGWNVANVEFSDGEWTFLVVQGEREAEVRIEAHRRGVTMVVIELSEPLPQNERGLKEAPQEREAGSTTEQPAPSPPPQSATPIAAPGPQPARAADEYKEGVDDLGDDGGGDD